MDVRFKERIARVIAAGLALSAGFADSSGYLRWHLFAANMTGNTVLLGIAATGHDVLPVASVAAPIAGFIAGCIIAKLLLERYGPVKLLMVEIVLLIAAAFAEDERFGLAVVALAMGLQNTTRADFANVKANTSFITGDYSAAAQALVNLLAGREPSAQRRTLAVLSSIIGCYALGAAVAAALSGLHITHILLCIVPVVAAVAYAARFA